GNDADRARFAPSEYRDTMLAAVFFCQPFGQFIAVLIAFAVTAGLRSHINDVAATHGPLSCTVAATATAGIDCARTIDKSWRFVAGLGAVPAAIAIYFRFTIPESVYYSLDVIEDGSRAADDAERFFRSASSSENQSLVDSQDEQPGDHPPEQRDRVSRSNSKANDSGDARNGISAAVMPLNSPPQPITPANLLFNSQSTNKPNGTDRIENEKHHIGPETLEDGQTGNGRDREIDVKEVEDCEEPEGFLRQLHFYLSRDANWKDLLASSINWMLLDFTFYLLGVNSSSFIPTLFGENNGVDRPAYPLLISEERNIMKSSTTGSLIGSLLAIGIFHFKVKKWLHRVVNSPRKIQIWGFGVLAVLFVIVGSLYYTLPTTNNHVAVVFFYQLCQLFYNLGEYTSDIPAQVFPTKFRCTCYGVAAASGKLGSVLGQIVVTEVTSNKRLGGTLIG
ncbi:MAG: hypothetical protein Q9214_005884, partial [Letrouitia sp. 1 TL-2023]